MKSEMQDAASSHHRIASSIRDLVVNPFSRWCDAHESRLQDCQDNLQARIKAHDRQAETVKKLRSVYFNKCRLLEDMEEENKLGFQEPETSPQTGQKPDIPEIKVQEEPEDEEEVFEIGDEIYQPDQLKKILSHMLTNIKMGEHKVAILGTYQNVSTGSDIVEYVQKHMGGTSISYAERIGQDLITSGLLRLIGNVGSVFANSSKMNYQWRPKSFKIAGLPETKVPLSRTFSMPSSGSEAGDSPVFGTVSDYLANWNVIANRAHPDETPRQRLQREARESDDKYKMGVRRLDELRCDLEENIFVHLKFLERCEFDRLKAIKTVILDFSGTIGNVIPSLQATVDRMMLFQETIQPQGDLRYLLENYRTGSFVPKAVVYENYYNKADEQTFGVDLEARARADKKRVPVIVTTILTYLDHHYPDLEGDESRRGVWLVDVPLARTHQLRARVNDGKQFSADVLAEYDVPTVASLLKLYLLELPGKFSHSGYCAQLLTRIDSLVSSHVYEVIRTLYNNPTGDGSEESRIGILQQALQTLRLTNIATLDACMNHFTRLIELTSAEEEYVAALAITLAPCVLRPRTETSLTLEEKHAYKLVRDLLAHKDPIFTELKRQSTLSHSGSVTQQRSRAISTDESNRRALMEERNRQLLEKANANRSRATSPAPSPRGHRRDRSSGGPETRFPIQTSPTSVNDRQRTSLGNIGTIAGGTPAKRSSLDVPDGEGPNGAEHSHRSTDSVGGGKENDKRDSMSSNNRQSAKFVGGRRVPTSPPSAESPRGVTLEDKPMDD